MPMSPVNSQAFRNIAAAPGNAAIYMDSAGRELRFGMSNPGPLARAVTWVGCKLGVNAAVRRQAEIRAAYTGFLDALGDDARYRDHAGPARARLDAGMTAGKPLTARKVRQVLEALDSHTGARENVSRHRVPAEAGPNAGANVYDPNSMALDPARISAAEVHGIMPHLLSDREKSGSGRGLTPGVQKADILHAKLDFLKTHHIHSLNTFIHSRTSWILTLPGDGV